MKLRRLYILLAVWCALVIVPGLLVSAGLFGRFDAHTKVQGGMLLVWVLGYLGQFAVFMWIMRILGEQKVLAWFVASLLPWVIDWTLPVSLSFVLLWFPITIALAGWIAFGAQQSESLRQHGIRAVGVVLEVLKPKINVVINNVYIKRKVRLRIERDDGVPNYEGILNGLFMLGAIPSDGDRMPLLVDPAKPQRFVFDKTSGNTHTASARPAAQSATRQGGIADELDRLAKLHDRGAITDSEFDAAKKKALRQ